VNTAAPTSLPESDIGTVGGSSDGHRHEAGRRGVRRSDQSEANSFNPSPSRTSGTTAISLSTGLTSPGALATSLKAVTTARTRSCRATMRATPDSSLTVQTRHSAPNSYAVPRFTDRNDEMAVLAELGSN
jgi:hypothetical protein